MSSISAQELWEQSGRLKDGSEVGVESNLFILEKITVDTVMTDLYVQ